MENQVMNNHEMDDYAVGSNLKTVTVALVVVNVLIYMLGYIL